MLGMRHQPHHVAPLVDHARHVIERTVHRLPVTQDDLSSRVELGVELVVCVPVSLAVLDGDGEHASLLAARRERGVAALDDQRDVAADERQRLVAAQHARKQAGLAEDLEAVADAEDETACGR